MSTNIKSVNYMLKHETRLHLLPTLRCHEYNELAFKLEDMYNRTYSIYFTKIHYRVFTQLFWILKRIYWLSCDIHELHCGINVYKKYSLASIFK